MIKIFWNFLISKLYKLRNLQEYEMKCKAVVTAQKMKVTIKDFFSKCDQIHRFLRIWSYVLKKSLMENFIFCTLYISKIAPFSQSLLIKKFQINLHFFLAVIHDLKHISSCSIIL